MSRRYGWKPDVYDPRDLIYRLPNPNELPSLPEAVDLRPQMPPVYDQGQLGSCTANALAGAVEFGQKKQGLPDFVPSRLMIYYDERALEGTIDQDAGAALRDGIKTLNRQGVCDEAAWPYDISRFTVKPPTSAYQAARLHRALQYQRVPRLALFAKACLASGYPFAFGFLVYDAFESPQVAQSGEVPLPAAGAQPLGGHAVLAVGYDNARRAYLVRNSWGAAWGQQGYFWMPENYLCDPQQSFDWWTIRLLSTP